MNQMKKHSLKIGNTAAICEVQASPMGAVGARDLRGELLDGQLRSVSGKVRAQVALGFPECYGAPGFGVELRHVAEIERHQDSPGFRELFDHLFENRLGLRIEIVDERLRKAKPHALQGGGLEGGGSLGDNAVEQHQIIDGSRHRPGCVSGVRDGHDAEIWIAAYGWSQPCDAVQCSGDAYRTF